MDEKNQPQALLLKIVEILNDLEIEYLITGGLTVSMWGRPRTTADIDAVINISTDKVDELARSLRENFENGYIDEKTAKDEIQRGGEFNFIPPEEGMKIDFWPSKDDEFDKARFKRKVSQNIDGKEVYFASAEDLILIKLMWYQQSESDKQLQDIESVLSVSGDKLDMEYIKEWAAKLGAREDLKKVTSE